MTQEETQFMFECCRKAHEEGTLVMRSEDHVGALPGMVIRRCPTCGRRHFEMDAEPGHFAVKLT